MDSEEKKYTKIIIAGVELELHLDEGDLVRLCRAMDERDSALVRVTGYRVRVEERHQVSNLVQNVAVRYEGCCSLVVRSDEISAILSE